MRVFQLTLLASAALAIMAPITARAGDPWGAIALDTELAERQPYYGVGGGATEQQATETALKFCKEAGGAMCTVMVAYEACGAIAVSGTEHAGWGKAPTKTQAEAQAVAGCHHDNCQVLASDCN